MLTGHAVLDISRKAEAAFSTEYLCAKLGTDPASQVNVAGAGEVGIGVAQAPQATAGNPISVRVIGITKAVASAQITAGAHVKCAASGKTAATTTQGDYCIGIALTAASGDGVIHDLLLAPHVYCPAA